MSTIAPGAAAANFGMHDIDFCSHALHDFPFNSFYALGYFGGMSEALFSILCSSNFGLFFLPILNLCRCTLFIFSNIFQLLIAKLLTFQFVILRTYLFGM